MKDELFKIEKLLSPRLAWMKNHSVKTHYFANDPLDEKTCSHCGFGHWLAYVGKMPAHEDDGIWSSRDTEDDAIVALAKGMEWRLWNEEANSTKPLNSK